MKGSVQGWMMNQLFGGGEEVSTDRPESRPQIYTYARTKGIRFFSGCCASQPHGERLRREAVCLLALKGTLQEREGLQGAPGSSTGHRAAWASGEVRRQ
jgi:hypothetical protein